MKIKELLSTPDCWTKKLMFADKDNNPCSIQSADKFCLWGAVCKCYPNRIIDIFELINNKTLRGITSFNDDPNTTFEDITNLVNQLDI